MLKGISRFISPELLAVLHQMGHGDELILADAHFPGYTIGPKVLRADGLTIKELLDGILPLFELDSYAPSLVMMQMAAGDTEDPAVEADYMETIRTYAPRALNPVRIDRYEFYERSKNAFVIVITGEPRKYGNLLLKKGVTPVM